MNLKTRVIASGTGLHICYQDDLMVLLEMTIAKGRAAYLGITRGNQFIISTTNNLFHSKFCMLPFNMAPYLQR